MGWEDEKENILLDKEEEERNEELWNCRQGAGQQLDCKKIKVITNMNVNFKEDKIIIKKEEHFKLSY